MFSGIDFGKPHFSQSAREVGHPQFWYRREVGHPPCQQACTKQNQQRDSCDSDRHSAFHLRGFTQLASPDLGLTITFRLVSRSRIWVVHTMPRRSDGLDRSPEARIGIDHQCFSPKCSRPRLFNSARSCSSYQHGTTFAESIPPKAAPRPLLGFLD
jgi:hypothetical protein